MRTLLCALFFAAASLVQVPAATANQHPNVLFIAVDDLNDWIGGLNGHPQVKTPHIDRLAQRGTLFSNAHCQSPLCNPSRSSLLTGLRPSSTGIYGLAPGIRQVAATKKRLTLPQAFRKAGYFTLSCGKIYHDGSIAQKDQLQEFDVWGPAPHMPKPAKQFIQTPARHPAVDWGVFLQNDSDQPDWKIADFAIDALQHAPTNKPFFIAVGFRLPHVPCYASQKWFDLYPLDTLILPRVKYDDRLDTPDFSWFLHWKLPEPRLSWLKSSSQWKPLVRSYLATVSFMDSQVGRLLDALDATGLAQNTIVVFWGDNGFHLGQKAITGKNSLWQESTRVPLIFAGPGTSSNARCTQPVELLDIYPSLIELCGLAPCQGLEGHSLIPQLNNAQAPRPWPAITTHNRGNHAIRSQQWRYIRYADGSQELYNLKEDPHEWTNLANQPTYRSKIDELTRWLPATNLPPAPGSAHRVLTYNPASKQATWEGQPVVPAEREQ